MNRARELAEELERLLADPRRAVREMLALRRAHAALTKRLRMLLHWRRGDKAMQAAREANAHPRLVEGPFQWCEPSGLRLLHDAVSDALGAGPKEGAVQAAKRVMVERDAARREGAGARDERDAHIGNDRLVRLALTAHDTETTVEAASRVVAERGLYRAGTDRLATERRAVREALGAELGEETEVAAKRVVAERDAAPPTRHDIGGEESFVGGCTGATRWARSLAWVELVAEAPPERCYSGGEAQALAREVLRLRAGQRPRLVQAVRAAYKATSDAGYASGAMALKALLAELEGNVAP